MKTVFLDMVWPALYVFGTFWQFWFLVIGTIVLELFTIRYFLKFSWKRSLIASVVGNLVSAIIGTFVMIWIMIFYHLVADLLIRNSFNTLNLVATYILMCLGSVCLEILVIHTIYKESFRKLFFPMVIGNFLSYTFIAFVMLSDKNHYFMG